VVELHVPGGVLTLEQRSALIKGVTDVVLAWISHTSGRVERAPQRPRS